MYYWSSNSLWHSGQRFKTNSIYSLQWSLLTLLHNVFHWCNRTCSPVPKFPASCAYFLIWVTYLFTFFFQAHRDITTIAQNIVPDLVVMFFIHSPCIIAERDPYITKNFLKLADVWHIVTFVLESCDLESWTFFFCGIFK